MERKITICICLLINLITNAQVGINTTNPDPSSVLDITSDDKGVLLPRVTLNSLGQSLSSSPNAISLLVYNLGTQAVPKGFYSWNGLQWVQLIDKTTVEASTYWAPQAQTIPKQSESKSDSPGAANKAGVDVDIFQKGKVGIGYSDQYQIDFNVNTSLKQLDVGGDFRTSHFNPDNSRYYGIETNSVALPSNFATMGNIIYDAESKDLEDYSFFDRPYNGSMFIQSRDKMLFLSRTGTSDTNPGANAHEIDYNANGINEIIYTSHPNVANDKMVVKSFNVDFFRIFDNKDNKSQFGLDFNSKKFFIGDRASTGYYFPNTRSLTSGSNPVAKDNQTLKYNITTSSLEWTDNIATPRYFYMPSVILPTVSNDTLIGTGAGANYTYNAVTQTFTVKIYNLFSNQFTTPVAYSTSTATNLSEFVKTAAEYDYFVLSADANVFTSITVNSAGELSYKINPNVIIKNGSFMNIALKVK